ncbi:MAG: glyoxalase/bleomycin resistance/extradiol dioxygenase family protein [Hyphomonadaceae bacterium]|nr:glyoxalase/bleomycin resistance/extradiol dioxygenase family protein [Hyphomonadaceae bacterium]
MTEQPRAMPMQGVIPYLAIENTDDAIAFYRRAFGALQWGDPARDDQGRVLNVSLEINGGMIMLSGVFPEMQHVAARGGQGFTLQLVVLDGDAWWSRAVDAGCAIVTPFAQQFWGDRYGQLRDPFGLDWAINEPSAHNQAQAMEVVPS